MDLINHYYSPFPYLLMSGIYKIFFTAFNVVATVFNLTFYLFIFCVHKNKFWKIHILLTIQFTSFLVEQGTQVLPFDNLPRLDRSTLPPPHWWYIINFTSWNFKEHKCLPLLRFSSATQKYQKSHAIMSNILMTDFWLDWNSNKMIKDRVLCIWYDVRMFSVSKNIICLREMKSVD